MWRTIPVLLVVACTTTGDPKETLSPTSSPSTSTTPSPTTPTTPASTPAVSVPITDLGFTVPRVGGSRAYAIGEVTGDDQVDLIDQDGRRAVVLEGPIVPGDDFALPDGEATFDDVMHGTSCGVVGAPGDVDGDGLSDLSCDASWSGKEYRGGFTLVHLGPILGTVTTPQLQLYSGPGGEWSYRNRSVGLGDLDGTPGAEVAIGWPEYAPTGAVALFGISGGPEPLAVLTSDSTGAFGEEVEEAGDLDGDGTVDLVVGSSEGVVTLLRTGPFVRGTDWLDGRTELMFPLAAPVAGVDHADLDGDGYEDVLVAANTSDEPSCIVSGAVAAGAHDVVDVAIGCWTNPEPVRFLRDLDGDGTPEVLFYQREVSPLEVFYLLSGRDVLAGVSPTSDLALEGGDLLQPSVSDLTGDGLDDLVYYDNVRDALHIVPGAELQALMP